MALILLLTCGQLSAAWEITRFVAYEGRAINAPDRRETWEAGLDPSASVSLADQALGVVSPGWRELEEDKETKSLDQDMLRSIEAFLEKVAIEYSEMGFADPVAAGWLDSVVVDASGQKAIRFYIREVPGVDEQGWYTEGSDCDPDGTSRKAFNINTLTFATPDEHGNRLVRGVDWATLAHELLHPVLYSSRFMKDKCKVGGWISEGIPDAISFDVTRKVRGINFAEALKPFSGTSINKLFGIRNYGHPLQGHIAGTDPSIGTTTIKFEKESLKAVNANINYPTSSFWRYLAEAKYTKSRHPNDPYPGSRANAGAGLSYVDYGYIVDMFDTDHPYSPDPNKANPLGDIRWVNEFLKSEKHIKSSLPRMYGRFISSFANYDVDRIKPAREAASPRYVSWDPPAREKWMRVLFTDSDVARGCDAAANPIGSDAGADIDVRVLPNAAACIQANPPPGPFPYNTAVDILVLGNELSLLKQLQIGLLDGSIVSAPEIYSFMESGAPYYARWSLPFSAARDGTYILINMSPEPEKTRTFTGNFRFSMGTWESDMTTVPIPPPEPATAGQSDGWRPTRREIVKKNSEASFKTPIQYLAPVPAVKRKGYDKSSSCDGQRLRLNMCGPQLEIKLKLNPFGFSNGFRGAAAADLYSGSMAVDGINPAIALQENFAEFLELEQQLEARDGDDIKISIPKIEYGFTGTFDNAVIRVDRASVDTRDNETDYGAYGVSVPRDNGPGKISRPPTGKVSIDEYSHYVLRGSFSAALVDDHNDAAGNPVFVRNITGKFNIPAPFTGDEDFEMVRESFEDEMIQNMLEMMPSGQLPVQEIMKQVGSPPAILCRKLDQFQLRAIGMKDACRGVVNDDGLPATLPYQCSCECNERQKEKPLPECQAQCEREWKQCPSGEARLSGDLAEEIAHYRSLMEAKGLQSEMQNLLIEQYRKMPAWQRKLTIQGYQ